MAISKLRLCHKDGDVIHLESSSDLVLRPDGTDVETSLSSLKMLVDGKADSSHTHILTDMSGILDPTHGGTGVTSLNTLKTALGISEAIGNITLTGYDKLSVNTLSISAGSIYLNGSGNYGLKFDWSHDGAVDHMIKLFGGMGFYICTSVSALDVPSPVLQLDVPSGYKIIPYMVPVTCVYYPQNNNSDKTADYMFIEVDESGLVYIRWGTSLWKDRYFHYHIIW